MLGPHEMPVKIGEILDRSIDCHNPLSLDHRLEAPHPTFSHPSGFVRLLGPIVGILISDMDRLWNYIAMGDRIASQLVSYDLPRFITMTSQ